MHEVLIEYLQRLAKRLEARGDQVDADVIDEAIIKLGRKGCAHLWSGPGTMPAKWTCNCGTVVYRSREDAIDD